MMVLHLMCLMFSSVNLLINKILEYEKNLFNYNGIRFPCHFL